MAASIFSSLDTGSAIARSCSAISLPTVLGELPTLAVPTLDMTHKPPNPTNDNERKPLGDWQNFGSLEIVQDFISLASTLRSSAPVVVEVRSVSGCCFRGMDCDASAFDTLKLGFAEADRVSKRNENGE